ncbi:MAG: hypothetical protein HYZ65_04660 [Burkholderiales bacterium]|nr:hypothetical protein [Burkholderiales bacterium]
MQTLRQLTLHRPARWLLCLLLPAFLLAQWAGMAHRLAHANWDGKPPGAAKTLKLAGNFPASGDDGKLHSCVLYDGTTAADYLLACAPLAPFGGGMALPADTAAGSGWHAPLRLSFFSRAPPFLNA